MSNYNPFSLIGKRILITGASSGIGRATALECSKLGASLVITGRNEERLNETYSLLEGTGHIKYICDLNNSEEIKKLIEVTPVLHGVVNNAGFTKLEPVQFIKEEDLKSIFNLNTFAPIMLLKGLLKAKKIERGSSIVFTSSMAGIGFSTIGNSIYTASKGAISAFIKPAALELASKGIRVNAVCPSMVATNILSSGTITDSQMEKDIENYPLGRYATPDEVAWSIIFLISDASSFITGTNLQIDGGYSLK